jgi:hypothetical protein
MKWPGMPDDLDLRGRHIENFGLVQNLMICGIQGQHVHRNYKEAICAIAKRVHQLELTGPRP